MKFLHSLPLALALCFWCLMFVSTGHCAEPHLRVSRPMVIAGTRISLTIHRDPTYDRYRLEWPTGSRERDITEDEHEVIWLAPKESITFRLELYRGEKLAAVEELSIVVR